MPMTDDGMPSEPLSATLRALAEDAQRERIAIGDLLSLLGDRAFGALLFVFAIPNVLPAPPGTSALLGAPLVFLAAQMALGRRPWLPSLIAQRSMPQADFARLVRRTGPWLAGAERLLRPRLALLTSPALRHLVGLVCFVLSVVLVLPVPLGNVLPAAAISVLALGLLQHDGAWVMAGLAAAAIALAVVWGVIYAIVKAALFFAAQVLS